MSSKAFIKELHRALESTNATTFAAGGREDSLPLPYLQVTNVGPVALPLQPAQADALRAVSVQASFGRGTETVIDTPVRSCRQIPAESISLSASWQTAIQALAKRYAAKLGVVDESVTAELYKLVLYDPGDFFKPHKDTEKAPGMFATLVLQLPSAFSSAEFIVSHCGQQKLFDNAEGSAEFIFATVFFGDCEHELREVSGGNRIVLLYNLVRRDSDAPCTNLVRRGAALKEVEKAADAWERDGGPENIVHMLEHEYTEKNISFRNLKGCDAQRVSTLRRSEKFDLFLALVEKHEQSMPSDPIPSSHRGVYYYKNDPGNSGGHAMEFVRKTTISLKKVIAEDDVEAEMQVLEVGEKETTLDGNGLFEGLPPDRENFYVFTGNDGAYLHYFHHRAVPSCSSCLVPRLSITPALAVLRKLCALFYAALASTPQIQRRPLCKPSTTQ